MRMDGVDLTQPGDAQVERNRLATRGGDDDDA